MQIWYVAKHDDVRHFRNLIENSCVRQTAHVEITDFADEDASLKLGEDDVLLDPEGNCPLKAFATSRTEIEANGSRLCVLPASNKV